MPTDDRDDEGTGSRDSGFIRTVLTDLFETIADMDEGERRREVGSAREGRTRFDFGFDVGVGPGTTADSQELREVAESDPDSTAALQPTETGYVATVDLPDVDPHELSAGVDSGAKTLVVADDGGVVGRVSLPDGDLEVGTASYNNGVLDVRLDAPGGTK